MGIRRRRELGVKVETGPCARLPVMPTLKRPNTNERRETMDAQLEKALGSIRLRKDVFSLLAMVKNENVNGRFDATIHEADLCLLYSRDLFKAYNRLGKIIDSACE